VFLSAHLPGEPPRVGGSPHVQLPPDDLSDLLDRGADVFRSVLDVASLPFYLDIDYLNARLPGHAFARPGEVFATLEPTYQAVAELLAEYGIETLPLMTGRGDQFAGRIPFNSPVFGRIAGLAPETPDWCDTYPTRLPPWLRLHITKRYARAYLAMGLLLEYFSHRVIRRAAAAALKDLGGHRVVVHTSDVPRDGQNGTQRLQAVRDSLQVLAGACQRMDVVLTVESPLPHLIGGSADEFAWILSDLPPAVAVCLDTGHTTLGQQWHRFLDVSGPRLSHIHANDHHGRFDDHLPPGDGCLDWPALGRDLQQVMFEGWIILELRCPDHRSLEDHFARARQQLESRLP
jgi:hypothetical protein